MSRWDFFFRNIQQDFKIFIFMLILLCGLRVGFIGWLYTYMNDGSTGKDIAVALFYGLRISLKTAGIAALLTWICCTVVNLLWMRAQLDKLRWWIGCAYIALLAVLFQARIPYYEQFHSGFNQFIYNTFRDDVQALFSTFVQEYQLFGRLAIAFFMTMLLGWLLKRWLNTGAFTLPQVDNAWGKLSMRISVIVVMITFMVFTRFGGSLVYSHSVSWKNAAVCHDEFLNEAILDDVQALYRAHEINELMESAQGIHINAERIRQYGQHLANQEIGGNDLEEFLEKHAQGPKVSKPKHIFIIIGESQAQWPLMSQYADLHIADGLKSLISEKNSTYVPAFLPNGPFTPMAVTGVVSGLAEVNLYPNYQPESYRKPYATAIAPQLKKLGYRTRFWYGGFSSWERIRDYVLAQGFDEFHAFDELKKESGNVWGADDKLLFETIQEKFQEDEQPTVDVILTVSNHAPYTVDLAKEGFPEEQVRSQLPQYAKNNKMLVKQLGHYWYADKYISEFVKTRYEKSPDSLFIITGDHADRMNIEPTPDLFTRYAIPLIIYGQGVNKQLLPEKIAGNHIHILPTLFELIAPLGFQYYSVGQSLTRGNNVGVNHLLWITHETIGKLDSNVTVPVPYAGTSSQVDLQSVQLDLEAMQAVSWWRIKNGRYF
ncbi:LTA synthase family protein [Pelosinus fermentans]|uniref:Sulfatase n=1 Tax=Pelosinus fermentans JBW45 TaxID=1192197 RepID=I9DDQ2_9FIRM|nr:alkaline phosphatase family protein [Pelosinus fermentans]AJQ25998.1 sulfatase [Pelosinus fermentans JBW45]